MSWKEELDQQERKFVSHTVGTALYPARSFLVGKEEVISQEESDRGRAERDEFDSRESASWSSVSQDEGAIGVEGESERNHSFHGRGNRGGTNLSIGEWEVDDWRIGGLDGDGETSAIGSEGDLGGASVESRRSSQVDVQSAIRSSENRQSLAGVAEAADSVVDARSSHTSDVHGGMNSDGIGPVVSSGLRVQEGELSGISGADGEHRKRIR